jgi:hypothetical protein
MHTDIPRQRRSEQFPQQRINTQRQNNCECGVFYAVLTEGDNLAWRQIKNISTI